MKFKRFYFDNYYKLYETFEYEPISKFRKPHSRVNYSKFYENNSEELSLFLQEVFSLEKIKDSSLNKCTSLGNFSLNPTKQYLNFTCVSNSENDTSNYLLDVMKNKIISTKKGIVANSIAWIAYDSLREGSQLANGRVSEIEKYDLEDLNQCEKEQKICAAIDQSLRILGLKDGTILIIDKAGNEILTLKKTNDEIKKVFWIYNFLIASTKTNVFIWDMNDFFEQKHSNRIQYNHVPDYTLKVENEMIDSITVVRGVETEKTIGISKLIISTHSGKHFLYSMLDAITPNRDIKTLEDQIYYLIIDTISQTDIEKFHSIMNNHKCSQISKTIDTTIYNSYELKSIRYNNLMKLFPESHPLKEKNSLKHFYTNSVIQFLEPYMIENGIRFGGPRKRAHFVDFKNDYEDSVLYSINFDFITKFPSWHYSNFSINFLKTKDLLLPLPIYPKTEIEWDEHGTTRSFPYEIDGVLVESIDLTNDGIDEYIFETYYSHNAWYDKIYKVYKLDTKNKVLKKLNLEYESSQIDGVTFVSYSSEIQVVKNDINDSSFVEVSTTHLEYVDTSQTEDAIIKQTVYEESIKRYIWDKEEEEFTKIFEHRE